MHLSMKSNIKLFSKADTILDYTSTHIKRAEIEHSHFGESDYLFYHQMEHFVTIWRNGKRQREPYINIIFNIYT